MYSVLTLSQFGTLVTYAHGGARKSFYAGEHIYTSWDAFASADSRCREESSLTFRVEIELPKPAGSNVAQPLRLKPPLQKTYRHNREQPMLHRLMTLRSDDSNECTQTSPENACPSKPCARRLRLACSESKCHPALSLAESEIISIPSPLPSPALALPEPNALVFRRYRFWVLEGYFCLAEHLSSDAAVEELPPSSAVTALVVGYAQGRTHIVSSKPGYWAEQTGEQGWRDRSRNVCRQTLARAQVRQGVLKF